MVKHRNLFLLLILWPLISFVVAEEDGVCNNSEDNDGSCSENDIIIEEAEADAEDCIDEHESCQHWAANNECTKNPAYMLVSCRKSCQVCHRKIFEDNDFGEPQLIPYDSETEVSTREIVSRSITYMQTITSDPEYKTILNECRNTDSRCSQWAIGSGCEDNAKYMKKECAPACKSCKYLLDLKKRCAFNPDDGKDAMNAGGMDALFERMVKLAEFSDWNPTVWSRPKKEAKMNEDGTYNTILPCEEDVTNPCNAIDGHWVITLENFVTPEEISALKEWGAEMGYERSQAGDEIIEARTSSHSWCTDACYEDPMVVQIRQRIVRTTGIPEENYECLQLLKYEVGQYYRPHVDFIEKHIEQSHGPRLLTFFIYLSEVEEGGGTRFPNLQRPDGLSIEPRPGRVLIWPSVLDSDVLKEDSRTSHEAVPVESGEKYAANAWIHLKDFQTPFNAGCPS